MVEMPRVCPSIDEEISVRCYQFLKQVWPHSPRTKDPDRGFERVFRRWIASKIPFQALSAAHNLGLGLSDTSLSGIKHELDIVGQISDKLYVFELKNYPEAIMPKDWVFVFFQKVFDYYLKNIETLHQFSVSLIFLTTAEPDTASRQVCFTWGINLIAPAIIPPLVVQYYLRQWLVESAEENELVEKLYKDSVELSLSVIFSLSRLTSILSNGNVVMERAFIDKPVRELLQKHKELQGQILGLGHVR